MGILKMVYLITDLQNLGDCELVESHLVCLFLSAPEKSFHIKRFVGPKTLSLTLLITSILKITNTENLGLVKSVLGVKVLFLDKVAKYWHYLILFLYNEKM